jgi:hypothetical protein
VTGFNQFRNATTEDIQADPHRYGAPTLEEFQRNKQKYIRNKLQDLLECVEAGSVHDKKTRRCRFEIGTQRFRSPEQVEKYVLENGIDLDENFIPVKINQGGHDEWLVRFLTKEEWQKRQAWR